MRQLKSKPFEAVFVFIWYALGIFFFSSLPLSAQQNTVDSLHVALRQNTSDSARYSNYIQLGDYFYNTQIYNDSAFFYTEKALAYSHEGTKDQARVFFNLGSIQKSLGNFDEAISNYKKAETIVRSLGIDRIVSSCLNNIGAVHFERGHYDLAIANYRSALEISKARGKGYYIAVDRMNIGEALNRKNDLLGSKKELEMALSILDSLSGEPPALVHFFYSQTLYGLNDLKQSKVHAKEALRLAKNEKNLLSISMISDLLADIAQEEGEYKKALIYAQQFALYRDSISSAKALNEVEKLKLNLALREKQENIDRYKQRGKYLTIIYTLVGGGLILGGIFIMGQLRIRRIQRELREMQCRLLKMKK